MKQGHETIRLAEEVLGTVVSFCLSPCDRLKLVQYVSRYHKYGYSRLLIQEIEKLVDKATAPGRI